MSGFEIFGNGCNFVDGTVKTGFEKVEVELFTSNDKKAIQP